MKMVIIERAIIYEKPEIIGNNINKWHHMKTTLDNQSPAKIYVIMKLYKAKIKRGKVYQSGRVFSTAIERVMRNVVT